MPKHIKDICLLLNMRYKTLGCQGQIARDVKAHDVKAHEDFIVWQ